MALIDGLRFVDRIAPYEGIDQGFLPRVERTMRVLQWYDGYVWRDVELEKEEVSNV